MPWTAQGSKNEAYVSSGLAVASWAEQATESETYAKNERYSKVYSNDGEQVYNLGGFPALALLAIESPWISQAAESVMWED